METGESALRNDGSLLNVTNKASLSSSSSKKREPTGNGSHYLSSVLPDRFPQKKRSPYTVNCFSGLPYRQKVRSGGGGVERQSTESTAQNGASACAQRVMSAKLLRVKQLQNQLSDTQNQLNELVNENRLLRTLQKRQAVALQRFEGSQDQLPQLIKSHNEEIRILNSKIKQMKEKYGDLENRLKRKDAELNYLKEHHKHLLQLSQDKQLVDREKLAKKVEILEAKEKEQTEKMQLLTRKLELEGKNYRHQLSIETNKLRETQIDLKSALGTINNLKAALEAREKYVNCSMPKKYQKSMEHLMQNTHVSLPIPPRVSIRQPDKFPDSTVPDGEESSSESDVSYSKIFDDKYTSEKMENRSSTKVAMNPDKPFESTKWGQNDQDSKSNSSSDAKDRGRDKLVHQSDDSLDGLKLNHISEAKKKKRLFTNVGAGREINSNYSFGNANLDPKYKERNPFRLNEIGRAKPRSRSLSKDNKLTHKPGILKKNTSGKHYLADRESSSDEHHRVNPKVTKDNDEREQFNSSLASFHQEMEYELDQVIRNDSSGVSPDADSEDIFVNCEPIQDDIPLGPAQKQVVVASEPKEKFVSYDPLEKFSKLSWNEMKKEMPSSKDEMIHILDQAHPDLSEDNLGLDEEKKASLLQMLKDIDNNFSRELLTDNKSYNKRINGDSGSNKITKTKKKHILEEIFR